MRRSAEVQMEARPGGEPGAHFGVFVRGVIIDDEMRIERRRHLASICLRKPKNP